MNGYELVRRQPQLILKTGDTITGNLTAQGNAKFVGNLQGNSDTTTRLATARNITIGNTARSFNGTANIAWTLNDIGAAAINHTHTGGTVNMNGYVKPGVGGAISANDTINQAIGKLEYGLDNKAPLVHNQGAHTINLMTGYNKGTTTGAIAQGDSLNTAIAKLENGVNSKANSNHTHAYLPLAGGTMSGTIFMKSNELNFDSGAIKVGTANTLQIVGAHDKTMGALMLGTSGCRIYALGNDEKLRIEGGFYTNKESQVGGNFIADGFISVGRELKGVTDIWGRDSNVAIMPKMGTGYNGGITLNWTGVQSPNGPSNQPRYELMPLYSGDVRIGSPNNYFHTAYVSILDFNGTTGIYPSGAYTLTMKCAHNQGGEAGEMFYGHSGAAYHFEPKWSGDVGTFRSTGLGRSTRSYRDVWSHMGYHQTSDITKKENIQKIVSNEEIAKYKKTKSISLLSSESISEAVKNLQPILFDYKNMVKTLEDGSIAEDDEISKSARQLGISAQDLEALNPVLFEYVGTKITTTNDDGDVVTNYSIKTLAYTNMLLVALQETMKRVEELEQKVATKTR